MITREQFEALVRAEAAKEFPLITVTEIDARQIDRRSIYIAARMEHEWPLVAELLRAKERFDYLTLGGVGMTNGVSPEAGSKDIAAALSPYTTKPIEP
jgi:hypothetical protein